MKFVTSGAAGRYAEAYADRFATVEVSVGDGRQKKTLDVVRVASFAASRMEAKDLMRWFKTGRAEGFRFDTVGGAPIPTFSEVVVSPMRAQSETLSGNLVQIVATAEALYTQSEDPVGVIVPDGDSAQAFYRRMMQARGCPLLPEWADTVLAELRQRDLVAEWKTYGDVVGFDVRATTPELIEVVQDLLERQRLVVPAGIGAPDVDLGTLKTLDGYMLTFGKTLGERVLEQSPARHVPGTGKQPAAVLRRLYQAQADTAEASVKAWAADKTVWAIGTQGVGKTLIGLAAARQQLETTGGRGRILVHAPNHLIPKWEREAKAALGDIPVHVIRTYRDALHALPTLRRRPTGVEVWLVPRDSGKLGYLWRPVAKRVTKDHKPDGEFDHWECPGCFQPLVRVFKAKDRPAEAFEENAFESRGQRNRTCPECGSSLWEASSSGPRREAPSRILRRKLSPKTFDVLLADEIHEEKGDTSQGDSISRLYAISKKAIFLTGTLLGGKASDLYWHLFRTQPERMKAAGYDYHNPEPFVRAYGVVERRTRTKPGGKRASATVEMPGVHPAVYGDWLMGNAIFLDLEDLQANLPPYEEEVVLVPMDEQQEHINDSVLGALAGLTKDALKKGARARALGFVQTALAYPDHIWANAPVTGALGQVLAQPRGQWDPARPLPKETEMLKQALREKAKGRRCLVYVEFTGKYDVQARFKEQFESVGLTTAVLTKKVPAEKREAWIEEQVKRGVDVLICHPQLVSTGLDLLAFPTIMFAQERYNLFQLRQASRRSWRIGQTQPVRVLFFAYEGTMQEVCLRVLGDKLLAAQAVEGRFSAEGLQALSNGQNTALILANALAFGLDGRLPEVTDVWRAGDRFAEGEIDAVPAVVDVDSRPAPDADGVEDHAAEPVAALAAVGQDTGVASEVGGRKGTASTRPRVPQAQPAAPGLLAFALAPARQRKSAAGQRRLF